MTYKRSSKFTGVRVGSSFYLCRQLSLSGVVEALPAVRPESVQTWLQGYERSVLVMPIKAAKVLGGQKEAVVETFLQPCT